MISNLSIGYTSWNVFQLSNETSSINHGKKTQYDSSINHGKKTQYVWNHIGYCIQPILPIMQNQKNRMSIKKWFYNHKGQPTWFSSGIGVGYLYALWLKIRVRILNHLNWS